VSVEPMRGGQRAGRASGAWLAPTDGEASLGGPPLAFSSAPVRHGNSPRVGDNRVPAPGQLAVLMAALLVGLLLMGMQLWLLTVALDLYLGGQGRQIWRLALVSGAIFAGGVVMLKVLSRRPRLADRPA
jgi:hypothetical protein